MKGEGHTANQKGTDMDKIVVVEMLKDKIAEEKFLTARLQEVYKEIDALMEIYEALRGEEN